MRTAIAALAVLATAVGCSGHHSHDGPHGTISDPIAFGSVDTIHTAVVAVLAPAGSSSFQECSGSIVKVSGDRGYVLTAAHCCNQFIPNVIVASNDYSVGEQYVFGGTPVPPAFPVIPGSVYYDAKYAGMDHDFCMLTFSGATASTPTLALPVSGNDGLSLGLEIEHVGFGFTETSTTNTKRLTGTDTLDQQLTPLVLRFSQGGPNNVPGTCDGDSGGPTLFHAGAPQSQQVVVGVQSFGSTGTCAQITFGGASRVTSEMGTGGFISGYLAGLPVGGIQSGGSTTPVPAAPAGGRWTIAELAAALLAAAWAMRRPTALRVPGRKA
jgi:hypothetical protein